MGKKNTMSVDDISDVDVAYIPHVVTYLDRDEDCQCCLLVFAESMAQVSYIADGFLRSVGCDFLIVNVSLMNVQYTLVQKAEKCQSTGTDELDDPIRR